MKLKQILDEVVKNQQTIDLVDELHLAVSEQIRAMRSLAKAKPEAADFFNGRITGLESVLSMLVSFKTKGNF